MDDQIIDFATILTFTNKESKMQIILESLLRLPLDDIFLFSLLSHKKTVSILQNVSIYMELKEKIKEKLEKSLNTDFDPANFSLQMFLDIFLHHIWHSK